MYICRNILCHDKRYWYFKFRLLFSLSSVYMKKCSYCDKMDYFLLTFSAVTDEAQFPVVPSLSFVEMTTSDPDE